MGGGEKETAVLIEAYSSDVRQVGRDTLNPILFLLQSHDVEVQRAASAALGNLAVNSKFRVLRGLCQQTN